MIHFLYITHKHIKNRLPSKTNDHDLGLVLPTSWFSSNHLSAHPTILPQRRTNVANSAFPSRVFIFQSAVSSVTLVPFISRTSTTVPSISIRGNFYLLPFGPILIRFCSTTLCATFQHSLVRENDEKWFYYFRISFYFFCIFMRLSSDTNSGNVVA